MAAITGLTTPPTFEMCIRDSTSPYTLYDEQTASFGEDEDYNQADADGFINLFGLPIAGRAKLAQSWPTQD